MTGLNKHRSFPLSIYRYRINAIIFCTPAGRCLSLVKKAHYRQSGIKGWYRRLQAGGKFCKNALNHCLQLVFLLNKLITAQNGFLRFNINSLSALAYLVNNAGDSVLQTCLYCKHLMFTAQNRHRRFQNRSIFLIRNKALHNSLYFAVQACNLLSDCSNFRQVTKLAVCSYYAEYFVFGFGKIRDFFGFLHQAF